MDKNIEFKVRSGNEYIFDTDASITFEKNSYYRRIDKINKIKESNVELKENNEIRVGDIEEYILKYGVSELVLEVTNACNFRCGYCFFSEHYQSHSKLNNKAMTFETMKRAVDIYFDLIKKGEKYNPEREPVVAFYGGEPLLNFKLIVECVNYIKEIYGKKVIYEITTNASLLTDDISMFFVENNFIPVFSLDGPKEIHDANRKAYDGKGTFEKVYSNIKRYIEIANNYAFINSVYDCNTDLVKLMEFWEEENSMILLSLSPVNPYDTDYYNQFNQDVIEKFKNTMRELECYFFTLIEKKDISKNEKRELNFLYLLFGKPASSVYMKDMFKKGYNRMISCTGSCVPGDKIFVNVEGNLYPCEKVDKGMIIGNLTKGLDYALIKEMLDEYRKKITSTCKTCKVKNVCSLCFQALHSDNGFCKDRKYCNDMIEGYKNLLIRATSLSEINPMWFDEFTTDYYSKIRELAVMLR